MRDIVARAGVDVTAPPERVWKALTDTAVVSEWMFGTTLRTDWRVGSPITWSGEFEGSAYEDRGEVVAYDEPRELAFTHFSPASGQDDVPENHHTVTFTLSGDGRSTHIAITQDNNSSEDEAARSTGNWEQALAGVKAYVESAGVPG